jgi:GR25 family glycosyltransferase involved in LPS biosynthesis
MNIEKILTKDVINQTDKNKERVKMSDILQKYKLVHIFCVVNKIHEKNRYDKLIEMFSDFDLHNYYKCMSTTWKDTITDEIIKKYIKSIDYLVEYRQLINLPPKRMSRAELSVILNHRSVLRYISKNYKDGYFLILESDVQFTENFKMFPDILKQLNENEDKWDIMYIGKMPQSNHYKNTKQLVSTDSFQIYTGKEDKTADAMVWKYDTIIKFLKYMKKDLDFKLPYDTYLQQFYRNEKIKFGWVQPELVYQETFYGVSKSNVQGDKEIKNIAKSYF